MVIHTDLNSFAGVNRPVLTTGTFDGVHHGHQVIIKRLNEIAKREKGESVLFTFHPHPRLVLNPEDKSLRLLNTVEEKQDLLERTGLDHLLVLPFSRDFSRLHAREFVRDVLVEKLHVHAMVVWHDHRFGRDREGGIGMLREQGEEFGFRVEEIPAQEVEHVQVSSTKVREALLNGAVERSHEWLGYPYRLDGVVVKGDQRGRTIGWPTANVGAIDPYKLIPANGVYAVVATVAGTEFEGMLNIGVRPTVEAHGTRTVEVNLFGLDREIYGEPISVRLWQRLRNEKRFAGLEELKAQLAKDKEAAMQSLSKR